MVSCTPSRQPMSTLCAEVQQCSTTWCTAKQTMCFLKAESEIVSITPVAHWALYVELQAEMQKIMEDRNNEIKKRIMWFMTMKCNLE